MHKFLFTFLSVFVIGFMPGIATGYECTDDYGTCNRGCRMGALGECERCPANTYQTEYNYTGTECTPCTYPDGTTKDEDRYKYGGISPTFSGCAWTITCDNHKYFDINTRECKQCDSGSTGREESFTYEGTGTEDYFVDHEAKLAAYSKENYCVKNLKYPLLLNKNTPLDKLGPKWPSLDEFKDFELYPSGTQYPIEYKDLEICVTIVKDDTGNEQPYFCPYKCSDCPDDIDPNNDGHWFSPSQFPSNYAILNGGFPDKTMAYYVSGYYPDPDKANAVCQDGGESPCITGGTMDNIYNFYNFTTEKMKNIYDNTAKKFILYANYITYGQYTNGANGTFTIKYCCTPETEPGSSESGCKSFTTETITLSSCIADGSCEITTDTDTDGKQTQTVKIIVKNIGKLCESNGAQNIGCNPGEYIYGVYKCEDDEGNACYNTNGETEIEPGDDISIHVNIPQVYRTISPSCEPCKIGYYCPGGSSDPIPCPAGTSSAAGSSAISNCYMNPEYNDTGTKFLDSVGSFYLPSDGVIYHYKPEN